MHGLPFMCLLFFNLCCLIIFRIYGVCKLCFKLVIIRNVLVFSIFFLWSQRVYPKTTMKCLCTYYFKYILYEMAYESTLSIFCN
jgi:hypothetical protein